MPRGCAGLAADPQPLGRRGPHPLLLPLEHRQLLLVHGRGAGVHGGQLGFRAPQLLHGVSGHSRPDGLVDPPHGPQHCRGEGRLHGPTRRPRPLCGGQASPVTGLAPAGCLHPLPSVPLHPCSPDGRPWWGPPPTHTRKGVTLVCVSEGSRVGPQRAPHPGDCDPRRRRDWRAGSAWKGTGCPGPSGAVPGLRPQ